MADWLSIPLVANVRATSCWRTPSRRTPTWAARSTVGQRGAGTVAV
ncbi:hypothetical protein [Phytohabitans suffuscus]|nr:hypothetical protein [Phytohabitans suffuscus]